MQPKLINLSEKDMRKYKKLNKKQIMFINKDNDYHENQPALDSPDVNWAEFENDFSSRAFLNQAALRLRALANAFEETARLHDYDNLTNAKIDFRYANYKNLTEPGAGYDSKADELNQFISRKIIKKEEL